MNEKTEVVATTTTQSEAKKLFLAKKQEQNLVAWDKKLITDAERLEFIASGKIKIATTNKRTLGQLATTKEYNAIEGKGFHSSNDALNQSSKDIDLENASYGVKINTFIKQAKKRLAKIEDFKKISLLTFPKVNEFKMHSEKFKALEYVSSFQANCIVKGYVASIDGGVKRAQIIEKKVKVQGGLVGTKADAHKVNSAK